MIDDIYLNEAKRIRKRYMDFQKTNQFLKDKYNSFEKKLEELKKMKSYIDKMDKSERASLDSLLALNNELEMLMLNLTKEEKKYQDMYGDIKKDEDKLYMILKENYKHINFDEIKNYIIKSIMDDESKK